MEGRESGLWIPASEHAAREGYEDDEDEEDDAPSTIAASEPRGREAVAA